MEERVAKAISYVFHPLLMPSVLTVLLFNLKNYTSFLIPFDAKLLLLAMIFALTFVFPLIFILVLKRKGLIQGLHLVSQEERVYPLAITAVFDFSAFYMIRQTQIPDVFYLFLLGSSVLILICLLINFYTKISIHMAGIGGLTGALIGLSLRLNIELTGLIVIAIFISGLTGYARLKLQAHQPIQVYLGFACGAVVMAMFMLI
jgi:hypothetical protein